MLSRSSDKILLTLEQHQKIGATLNLKGLVGSVANKNQLVHWQIDYQEIYGDEYPSKEAWRPHKQPKSHTQRFLAGKRHNMAYGS